MPDKTQENQENQQLVDTAESQITETIAALSEYKQRQYNDDLVERTYHTNIAAELTRAGYR